MEYSEYLILNEDEVFSSVSAKIMVDPSQGKQLIQYLIKSERYQADFSFRASVDTAHAMLTLIMGDCSAAKELITELVDRVVGLGLWKLEVVNWNLLGNVYRLLQMPEKALECYCHVINLEKKREVNEISSVAYYNISVLFSGAGADDRAADYVDLSIRALEEKPKKQDSDFSKMAMNLTFYLQLLCRLNNLSKAEEVYRRLLQYPMDSLNKETKFSFYAAELFYKFHSSDRSCCEEWFENVRVLIDDRDILRQCVLIHVYVELCEKFQIPYEHYEQQILKIAVLPESPSSYVNAVMYRSLRKYYLEKKQESELEEATTKYIAFLEQALDDLREHQRHSLDTVETLMFSDQRTEMQVKNVELKMISEEALKTKKELEKTYKRLEIISAIGKQLMASTDLDEVIEMIFQTLKSNILMETFLLMAADNGGQSLRSMAVYYNERLHKEVEINVNDPESQLAKCFRERKTIVNERQSSIYPKRLNVEGGTPMNSAVFSPLKVGEKMVGAYSVQCKEYGAYQKEQLLFLRDLEPYLAMALNNALQLWQLEEEIQSRKLTQERLEEEIQGHKHTQIDLQKAYNKLEMISSLDGLTQISGRRDFEAKFLQMLEQAYGEASPVAVFMMDIDYFKLYNDTYGHLEGDEVLKRVAAVFRSNLNKVSGLSARFGGEEFIGACSAVNFTKSKELAEEICREIYSLNIENREVEGGILTVSIGVAIAERLEPRRKSEIMRLADESLYAAKKQGKNRAVICSMDANL